MAKYAKTSQISTFIEELRAVCEETWSNGKQQCESPSLRGYPCSLGKHDSSMDHSSGVVYISTCNCGRTQGRRDDPYTIRQANYDFYLLLSNNCIACSKLENVTFAVFEPSTKDFR